MLILFKKTVIYSNEQLRLACQIEQCMLIDNRNLFTTQNGAPRQRLYRDSIYPSPAGVAKLGCLLFDSIMLQHPASTSRHLPSETIERVNTRPLPPYRPLPSLNEVYGKRRTLLPTPRPPLQTFYPAHWKNDSALNPPSDHECYMIFIETLV